MKLSTLVLYGLLVAGGYVIYQQNQKIAELEASLSGGSTTLLVSDTRNSGKSAEPVVSETKAAQRIVCPACSGEGRLMMRATDDDGDRRRVTRMGGGGSDKPYPCPVCGSVGYRQAAPLPAGFVVCPDCLGMRLRAYSQHDLDYVEFNVCRNRSERLVGRPCMRCGATGQVKGANPL